MNIEHDKGRIATIEANLDLIQGQLNYLRQELSEVKLNREALWRRQTTALRQPDPEPVAEPTRMDNSAGLTSANEPQQNTATLPALADDAAPIVTPLAARPARSTPAPHAGGKTETLEQQVAQGVQGATTPLSPLPKSHKPTAQATPGIKFSLDLARSGEFWMNKIGIALLLLGLAFLFKYSIDRGWLTEWMRVGFGLAVGAGLLVAGLRLHERMRHFSQVLLGGSCATFYITGFAAYQLFHIVAFGDAFLFMIGVTTLAFALAVKQNTAVLALIGVIGGLATPFLLYSNDRNILGLVAYTCLALAGAGAIFLFRGWRSLLWTAFSGGWAIMLVTIFSGNLTVVDKWSLQAGVVFCGLIFWLLPVVRELAWTDEPQRWFEQALDWLGAELPPRLKTLANPHVYVLATVAPLMTLMFSANIWNMTKPTLGLCAFGAAVAYAIAFQLIRERDQRLGYTHAAMSVLLFTLGVVLCFNGNALLFALAAEAVALHFIANRLNDNGALAWGHMLMAAAIYWLVANLALGASTNIVGAPRSTYLLWSADSLTNLAVIGLIAAAALLIKQRQIAALYLFGAELALLGWLWSGLIPVGAWWAAPMLAAGAYGVALLLGSRRLPQGGFAAGARINGHIALGSATLALLARLIFGPTDVDSLLSANLPANALMIDALLAAVWALQERVRQAIVYRSIAHGFILFWLARELGGQPNGPLYIVLAWAFYATLLHVLTGREEDSRLALTDKAAGHVAFLLASFALQIGYMPITPHGGLAVLNINGLCALAAIVLALFAANRLKFSPTERSIYHVGSYTAVVVWLWRELGHLSNSESYTFFALALFATLLSLLAGRIKEPMVALTTRVCGHVLFGGLACWLVVNSMGAYYRASQPIVNLQGAVELGAIALALLAANKFKFNPLERTIYHAGIYLTFASWLWAELGAVPDGESYTYLALTLFAITLSLLSERIKEPLLALTTRASGHSLFGGLALWLAANCLLEYQQARTPILNLQGMVELGAILLALTLAARQKTTIEQRAYQVAGHGAMLLYLWAQFVAQPSGSAMITLTWGVYGAAVLVAGALARRDRFIVNSGIAMLGLVAGKLLLLDMTNVDALWRILLFIGFGGLFLLLSYYLQNVLQPAD